MKNPVIDSPFVPGTAPAGAAATPPTTTAAATAILGLTRDSIVRDFLMEVAIERGYGLYCAADGPDALRVLALELPGLILVDVDVPDGRALVRTLRAEERWRNIPILALTVTNNPMVAVSLDLPVFFKPDLDGLEDALLGRFEPRRTPAMA